MDRNLSPLVDFQRRICPNTGNARYLTIVPNPYGMDGQPNRSCRAGACPGQGRRERRPYVIGKMFAKKQEITALQCRGTRSLRTPALQSRKILFFLVFF
jgi:hypothetical protein